MQNTTQPTPPPPPPVSPYLTVEDSDRALRFYADAFGACEVFRNTTPDGAKIIHAAMLINGGLVMLSDDFPEMNGGHCRSPRAIGGTPVTIHLDLPDVDVTWQAAIAAGAKVVMPLGDMFWGDRYGIVEDPFGHRWSLATRKRQPTQADIEAGTRKHFG